MAWARTGIDLCDLRVLSQGAFGGVERIREYLVEPEISDQGETVVGRHGNRVGVRLLLPFLVHSRPVVLHKGRRFAEAAIFQHRENGDAAPRVV